MESQAGERVLGKACLVIRRGRNSLSLFSGKNRRTDRHTRERATGVGGSVNVPDRSAMGNTDSSPSTASAANSGRSSTTGQLAQRLEASNRPRPIVSAATRAARPTGRPRNGGVPVSAASVLCVLCTRVGYRRDSWTCSSSGLPTGMLV